MALPIGEQQDDLAAVHGGHMTEQFDPQPTDKVLEIGTGSGYQAAILARGRAKSTRSKSRAARQAPPRGRYAARTIRMSTSKSATAFKAGPSTPPFDKIIVTCSPEKVPQPLVDQLRKGAGWSFPLGERYHQTLYLFEKRDGKLVAQAMRADPFRADDRQCRTAAQRPARRKSARRCSMADSRK